MQIWPIGRLEQSGLPAFLVGWLTPKEPVEVYGLHKFDLADLDQFHVLARSEGCVQAILHRERPLYGVIFHPEVRRGNVVSRFLEHHGGDSGV